ncbi:MAG TPA: oligosaccharide flippase family protein, partial [Gammaproteobacteria bacterium]
MDLFSFGALARNTLWMILGQGLRLVVQFAYFVLIARVLHKDGYGAFSGAVALVAVLAPFAGWGSGSLLVKNVARDLSCFPLYWGRALTVSCVSAAALIALALMLAYWILPSSVSLLVVLCIAISDLLFARLLEVAGQAFQAVHQLAKTAALWVLLSVARLLAVLVLIHVHSADDLMTWSWLYLLGTAVVAAGACAWVTMQLGRPDWRMSDWRREFSEGFFFAASVSAQRIYMDSDKALLTRLASLEAAGIYAAASRMLDVAFVPVNALLSATYTRFFMHGTQGVDGTIRFSKRLLPYALAYSAMAGIGLYLLAPLIPLMLGQGFYDAIAAVRWLAVVPLLMTLHRLAADSLTGAGKQTVRTH